MISIVVPSGSDGGIFNRVSGTAEQVRQTCKELADQVHDTITHNYGHSFPAYLECIVSQREKAAVRARRMSDNFIRAVGGDTDPWSRRLAQKFGYVLAGAVLMSDFGIAPWNRKQAWRAIKRMYRTAQESLPASVPIDQYTDSFVERIMQLVSDSRKLPFLAKNKKLSAKQSETCWGVVRKLKGVGSVALMPLRQVKEMCGSDADIGDLLNELYRRGLLVRGADGKNTRQVMVKGLGDGRARYVCLRLLT
jgi:hypothetical protein